MLEVRGLHAGYGSIEVVRDTSITVAEGELVGLVGHNGVGKSTTLKAIAGIVAARAGTIEWLGKPLTGGATGRIRHGIAYVPEDRRIFTQLSVAENLQLGATVRDKADAASAIERELERFPILRKYYRRRAGDLSGGEQQMLAIGRCLMGKPDLVMFDEPSLGLAPAIVQAMLQTIRELNRDGLTCVLVEQNVAVSLKLASRAYVLENGRMTLSGTGEELLADDRVRQAYLGM